MDEKANKRLDDLERRQKRIQVLSFVLTLVILFGSISNYLSFDNIHTNAEIFAKTTNEGFQQSFESIQSLRLDVEKLLDLIQKLVFEISVP